MTDMDLTIIEEPCNTIVIDGQDVVIVDSDRIQVVSAGVVSSSSLPGPQGDRGPQGDAGVAGPQGDAGVAGPQGRQGYQGDAGVPGPQGDAGAAGPQGYQGDAGAAGPQGDAGVAGPQGRQGYQGDAGVPGPQGVAGVAGPQGDAGVAGPQGRQGYQGDAGVPGPQGVAGVAGPQGRQGYQGDAGVAGPQGRQGYQGDAGVPGPQGDAGAAGPQGVAGVAGPQGRQGYQGDAGVPGPQGDAGAAGPQGDAGVAGPQGDAGVPGPQGSQGYQGVAGAAGGAGPQGYQGYQGVAGAAGPQGVAGVAGPQGSQGYQGVAGAAGGTGPQGSQGYQGVAGAAGGAGPQGSQGYQGVAGGAGPQGYQGSAGGAGPQGAAGQGVPIGGATGQVLSKASATDFDTTWTVAGSGGGGTTFTGTLTGAAPEFRLDNTNGYYSRSTRDTTNGMRTYNVVSVNTTGTSGSFDGNTSYGQVARNTAWETSNITVTAWIYATSLDQFRKIISRPFNTSSAWNSPYVSWSLGLGSNASSIRLDCAVAGGAHSVEGAANLTVNTWHFVCLTYNGTTATLYRDGASVGSGNMGGAFDYSSATDLAIGARSPYSLGDYWSGLLKDIRIFDYVLPTGDITTMATGAEPSSATLDHMVAQWTFNDNTGSTATDSTATGADATLSGVTWSTSVPAQNPAPGASAPTEVPVLTSTSSTTANEAGVATVGYGGGKTLVRGAKVQVTTGSSDTVVAQIDGSGISVGGAAVISATGTVVGTVSGNVVGTAALTGTPTAPTPATATNSTQIATTAYVKAQAYAPLAGPAFTGTPTAPTAATTTNSTQIATTAYVKAQGYGLTGTFGAVATKTANYTCANTDGLILIDATSAAVTITMPAVGTANVSKVFYFKRIDSSVNVVTVQRAGTNVIDNGTSVTLNNVYSSLGLISDGTSKWWIISKT